MQRMKYLRVNTFSAQCVALLLGFLISFTVSADVVLKGGMKIGDNNTKRIHPRYLLSAADSKTNENLNNPRVLNPINFHLSKDINLTQIRLENAASINASLYFVIWDSSGQVRVNSRSTSYLYANSQRLDADLPAGNYKLAVVGQCFNRGGHPKGWRNSCNKNWDYEDFSFTDITLASPQTSNSITFLQRRHIGDSNERPKNGYAGRWYPDDHEGDEVEYEFTARTRSQLQTITMYNYRDLIPNQNNVKLKLSGDNFEVTTWMNLSDESGDFVWRLNKTLLAGREYELEIEVDDDGDADDISWDDIVLKMGSDSGTNIDHYRLNYSERALTCEPTTVTVQACSNRYQVGGACVETTNSTTATLIANAQNSDDKITKVTGSFVGSTNVNLGYLTADDMTLSLTAIKNKAYYCNGAANSGANCDMNFADAGFFFSYDNGDNISNQVAGLRFSKPIKLEAFYNDKGQCKNIFKNNEIIPVNLGIQCKEPGTCSALDFIAGNIKLGKNNGDNSTNYEPVALKFNRNGTLIDNALYQDAGKINLIASYTIDDETHALNGLSILGASNQFAVRPYRFKVYTTDTPRSIDLTAKDNDGNLLNKYVAGTAFNFNVAAVNRDGITTTNYQPNDNSTLKLKLTRSIPIANAVEGQFKYADGTQDIATTSSEWFDAQLTSFTGGASTYKKAYYSEAGAFQINVKDDSYYTMAFSVDTVVAADTAGKELGRFIPSHFKLISSSVTNYVGNSNVFSNDYDYIFPEFLSSYVAGTKVLQQKDNQVYECREWPNNGFCVQWSEGSNQYEPGIGSAWEEAWVLSIGTDDDVAFTYMDQPELIFDYRLEAQNTQGIVTKNYDADKATVAFIANSDGLDFSPRLQHFGGTWCYGVYQPGECNVDSTYGIGDAGLFKRLANGEDGPIRDTFFGISVTDLDGVELVDKDMPANKNTAKRLSSQASELRYGRWNISDGYGPINDLLPVAMQLEYFDGQQFIINHDDSLTEFVFSDAEAQMKGSSSGISLTGSGPFIEGESQALLISSKNPGKAILEYINTPPWLQYDWTVDSKNPTAIITFGFFYGNDRVIYRRRLN
ncbi:DUF6701 domain-containing protein [Moritella sp. F3]|uniref:DUF6701 domain-containing protein n=1 Tax=Moritella sp. F3 TaxID=2718882 RepID=UPI0018E1535F|nr:DUF6701 domain-containing protein [Moritella sp. F3]GIC82805.1 hypothetical protein FMO003_30850 [Moritella sp. F3]